MSLLSGLRRMSAGTASRPVVPAQAVDHPLLGVLAPDGKSMDAALALMADAVSSLELLDAKCRALIAKDNLAGYNSDWRFGQRELPNGALETFERPGDCDMFWGHSLKVDSFDGVRFEDVHASMFG